MRSLWIALVLVLGLVVGGQTSCNILNPIDRTPSVNGLGGAGGSAPGVGPGSGGSGAGLPCEIAAILVQYCDSCHGSTPVGGAPRSLVTYADLTRPDLLSSNLTEAQAALQRIQSQGSPMPPAPATGPTAAEVAILKTWVSNGYPQGACGSAGAAGASGANQGGAGASGTGGASGGSGGTTASGGASGASDAGAAQGDGLPCNLQTFLATRCDSCHGSTPSGGAPRSLVSYANLTASDPASPGMTEAQVALQRIQSTTSPMPPAPASPATSSEIAALQAWVDSGYPRGGCATGGSGGTQSGGGGTGGNGDAGSATSDPLDASPTCTSNTTWKNGTEGSSSMEPGQACIGCHTSRGREAPTFVVAGTLYPTGHEPDNCNGASGTTSNAKIVVTGSNGTSLTLIPNGVGNFYSTTSLPAPYQAKVVNAAGVERVMASAVPTGDCNSCHTQTGANGAPGRITLP